MINMCARTKQIEWKIVKWICVFFSPFNPIRHGITLLHFSDEYKAEIEQKKKQGKRLEEFFKLHNIS